MTKRTTECYNAVFEFIEKRLLKLEPDEFITDFEQAMRNAIQKRYPNAVLRGCWYHFCAAIRKKMMSLGLHSLLKSNSKAAKIKIMLMNLPLLPAKHFSEGYQHIKCKARKYGLLQKFQKFFVYFENYWFAQVSFS